jgi:hypothetical protein
LFDIKSIHIITFFTPATRHSRKKPNSSVYATFTQIKTYRKFFSYRVISKWKNLPKNIGKLYFTDITNPVTFARYLDKLPVSYIVPLHC